MSVSRAEYWRAKPTSVVRYIITVVNLIAVTYEIENNGMVLTEEKPNIHAGHYVVVLYNGKV